MRARRLGVLVTGAMTVAATSAVPMAVAAAPSGPAAQPLQVADSTVVQSARRIVWRLELTRAFTPATLRRSGRSLCLLVERPRGGSVSGQLCVIAPRGPGRPPRIVYASVRHGVAGHAAVLSAAVGHRGARLTVSLMPTAFDPSYHALRWQVRNTLRPPACTPRGGHNPLGCVSLFPRSPHLVALHTPRLVGCVSHGPQLVFQGPSDRKEIALTFDDGPFPDTPRFLDILEHYRVPATFFEIGDQIATYGQGGAIERRMLVDGDMIGDHTWSHPNVAAGGPFARGQIERAAGAIRAATGGFEPCLFRSPYGALSSTLTSEARSLGFTTIQWDVDPRDWATPGVGAIVSNVLDNAHPGAIVIQHDGGGYRAQTLAALPQEITTLQRRGYRFETVTQMLGDRLVYR